MHSKKAPFTGQRFCTREAFEGAAKGFSPAKKSSNIL
jgi:hypothetical protein